MISLGVIGVLLILSYLTSYRVRDQFGMWYYDLRYGMKVAASAEEIDKILAGFEQIPYDQLPATYLTKTRSDQHPYAKMLRGATYYLVPYEQIYTPLVGKHRIRDFMPKDEGYQAHIFGGPDLIWLVDKRTLKKLLLLEHLLVREGHDPEALTVVNGYRHPAYNQRVGGASQSRHIVGEAIDLSVGDIDQNGTTNQADKQIVLDLLDQEVIGSFGGLGLYPNTQSVHMDVRGYRARWNTY